MISRVYVISSIIFLRPPQLAASSRRLLAIFSRLTDPFLILPQVLFGKVQPTNAKRNHCRRFVCPVISLTFCPQRSPGNRNTIDSIKPALTLYNNHFPVLIYFPVFCLFRSLHLCRTSTAHFSLLLCVPTIPYFSVRCAVYHRLEQNIQQTSVRERCCIGSRVPSSDARK